MNMGELYALFTCCIPDYLIDEWNGFVCVMKEAMKLIEESDMVGELKERLSEKNIWLFKRDVMGNKD